MRISPEHERLLLDPPSTRCPHCGSTIFQIRGRASGVVVVNHDMRDGSQSENSQMWESMRTSFDDAAWCSDCGTRLGRIVGSAPGTFKPYEGRTSPILIETVGLCHVADGRILLVRKRGEDQMILPGGKRDPGETDVHALRREVREELGTSIMGRPRLVGVFRDAAGHRPDTDVEITLYAAPLRGEARPCAEIESLHWITLDDRETRIAPSLRNLIKNPSAQTRLFRAGIALYLLWFST